jgi:hypothetical protein
MAKSDLDAAEIARLESLGIDELRQEWRRRHLKLSREPFGEAVRSS